MTKNQASLNFTSFVTAEYSFMYIQLIKGGIEGERIIKNNHNKEWLKAAVLTLQTL